MKGKIQVWLLNKYNMGLLIYLSCFIIIVIYILMVKLNLNWYISIIVWIIVWLIVKKIIEFEVNYWIVNKMKIVLSGVEK